jgi:hypothetical protein
MPGIPPFRAMIGVGADEQSSAVVVGHHLIQKRIRRPAEATGMRRIDRPEWMVIEIE